MAPDTLAILYALTAALAWGSGDFVGGYLSRRISTFRVILFFELSGGIALTGVALLSGEPFPAGADLAFGAVAGAAGIVGLFFLYRGLALYPMGLVAPLAAILTGIVPVAVGVLTDGLPGWRQMIGMVLALVAVWWIAGSKNGAGGLNSFRLVMLKYPIMAGLGFGLFFVLMDRVSQGAVFWPIVSSRTTAYLLIAGLMLLRKEASGEAIPRGGWFPVLIVLGGVFDTAGNVFFVLAAQAGRLDISSVLSSLFPAATVFLAWLFLRERLTRRQFSGVIVALVSVALIAS